MKKKYPSKTIEHENIIVLHVCIVNWVFWCTCNDLGLSYFHL